MSYVMVRHKVAEYAKWKPVYDEHASARRAGGCRGARLYRSADDPNELVVLTEWPDVEAARRFAQSPDLRATMQRAGVTGQPDVLFLEEVQWTPT